MSGSEVRELLEKRELRERERIKNHQEMAVAREQLENLKDEKNKLPHMKKLMKRMRRRMLRDQLQLQKMQENKEKTEALLVQHKMLSLTTLTILKTLNAQLGEKKEAADREVKEAADREVLICCERDEFKGLVQVAEQKLDISDRLAQDQSEEAASASQRLQEIRDECVEKGGWSRVNHRTAEARVTWANTSTVSP